LKAAPDELEDDSKERGGANLKPNKRRKTIEESTNDIRNPMSRMSSHKRGGTSMVVNTREDAPNQDTASSRFTLEEIQDARPYFIKED
jgi:hypothetical protein